MEGLYWQPRRHSIDFYHSLTSSSLFLPHFRSSWWRARWGVLWPWLSTIGNNFTPFHSFSPSEYLSPPFPFLFSFSIKPFASYVGMVFFFSFELFHDFTQCMSLPVYITPVFLSEHTNKHNTAWKHLLHCVIDCSSKGFISTSSSYNHIRVSLSIYPSRPAASVFLSF